MRSRNLKPGLFKNEVLGRADPLFMILFEGLWCEADREGRLEDRPLRLCAEIFPHRRSVTEKRMDAMLQWLHEREFVQRYQVAGKRYIQVIKFLKHQNPHTKERPSTIPTLNGVLHHASTGEEPDENESSTSAARLIPDSGFRTPDSGLLIPDSSLRSEDPDATGGVNSVATDSQRNARLRRDTETAARATRRIPGAINKNGVEEPEGEKRRKALTLLAAGMAIGDVAKCLHLSAQQVEAWAKEARA